MWLVIVAAGLAQWFRRRGRLPGRVHRGGFALLSLLLTKAASAPADVLTRDVDTVRRGCSAAI